MFTFTNIPVQIHVPFKTKVRALPSQNITINITASSSAAIMKSPLVTTKQETQRQLHPRPPTTHTDRLPHFQTGEFLYLAADIVTAIVKLKETSSMRFNNLFGWKKYRIINCLLWSMECYAIQFHSFVIRAAWMVLLQFHAAADGIPVL